ncbi:MAG: hypothetical protein V6D39_18880, partial [Dolichospermum lemmermannii FEM_B0920]
ISNPLEIIFTTRIGLIYSFKVLFFLGSVAGSRFSLRHLINIAIFSFLVKGVGKIFFREGKIIAEIFVKIGIQPIS